MKRFTICVMILAAMTLVGKAETAKEQDEEQLKLTLTLADGSRLIGTPDIKSVPIQTLYARIDITLAQIRAIEMAEDHETASVDLINGDKLTGVIDLAAIELETLFGNTSVGIEHIESFRVIMGGSGMPAGEGTLAFGGVNWLPWLTEFEVQDDKLVSLPKARAGFNYGHSGNGRGPMLMTNVGSKNWKDYAVEFEYAMTGVNAAFNPHGLPLSERGGAIMFHVADSKESWNERGQSRYALSLNPNGAWSLGCVYNMVCPTSRGYSAPTKDGARSLATGAGLNFDAEDGNKFRIEIRGSHIQIWVDDKQIADVRDDEMDKPIGGQTLDHGGVGFSWKWESMGWIRTFSARQL
jgi:hypothetical protein